MNNKAYNRVLELLDVIRGEFPALTNEEFCDAAVEAIQEFELSIEGMDIEECLN